VTAIFDKLMHGDSLAEFISASEDAFQPSTKHRRLLHCPFAVMPDDQLKTQGKYGLGYPVGAIIHATSGRHGLSAYQWALEQGYTFFLIDQNGATYQGFDLDRWGWHAGTSYHPGVGYSLSQHLVGIEITSAGKLVKESEGVYKAWFDEPIIPGKVRTVSDDFYPASGSFEKFTYEQERALVRLLVWLKWNKPSVFRFSKVLGHDEVSNGKTDPGGCLSVPMPVFRKMLAEVERSKNLDIV